MEKLWGLTGRKCEIQGKIPPQVFVNSLLYISNIKGSHEKAHLSVISHQSPDNIRILEATLCRIKPWPWTQFKGIQADDFLSCCI